MHGKVHYKNMSRITNGSHMSNTTRVMSVQSRFPTLIQSWTKLLGRLALLKSSLLLPPPLMSCKTEWFQWKIVDLPSNIE